MKIKPSGGLWIVITSAIYLSVAIANYYRPFSHIGLIQLFWMMAMSTPLVVPPLAHALNMRTFWEGPKSKYRTRPTVIIYDNVATWLDTISEDYDEWTGSTRGMSAEVLVEFFEGIGDEEMALKIRTLYNVD